MRYIYKYIDITEMYTSISSNFIKTIYILIINKFIFVIKLSIVIIR